MVVGDGVSEVEGCEDGGQEERRFFRVCAGCGRGGVAINCTVRTFGYRLGVIVYRNRFVKKETF